MGKKPRRSRERNLRNNPNGANQWIADPRQQLFLAYYLDPKSKTFSNALQSALRAGFAQEYAESILSKMPDWLAEKVGNSSMLLKAERNLEEALDFPSETQAMSMFGPMFEKIEEKKRVKLKNGKFKTKIVKKNGKPIMRFDKGLIKIKSDVSMFVAERIGRDKYGKDEPEGGDVYNVVIFANDQRNKIAQRIVGGGSTGGPASQTEPS